MSPRARTSRLIHDVQQVVGAYVPKNEQTDRLQLAALAKEVLASIDIRDLRATPIDAFVGELEELLAVIDSRRREEVNVDVRFHDEGQTAIIQTCVEDQPFLVSTIRAALAAEGYEVVSFVNAIVRVRRNPSGRILSLGAGSPESVIRVEATHRGPDGVPAAALRDRIALRLDAVQAMVRDFGAMKETIVGAADGYFAAATGHSGPMATVLRETEELLRWLCDDNCVLLAVEAYDREARNTAALGLGRVLAPLGLDPEAIAASARGEGKLARFDRSADESMVHRAGKPGRFLVTRFGSDGEPHGCIVVHLLFTYQALHTPREQVPVIRMALREMLADRKVVRNSDRGRHIANAFNSLPLEYLFSQDRESVWELTDRILRAEVEGGSDVHIRVGEGSRFAFVVIALPRRQFSEELRMQVQGVVLAALGATYADYGVYIDRDDNAVIHFYVTGAGQLRTVDTEGLRQEVLGLARSWQERLEAAIDTIAEGARISELASIYEDAFDDEHRRRCSIERIAADIVCLEKIRGGADLDCDLYVSEFGDHPGTLNLRLFARKALSLSEELPVIANFGFVLIDQYSRDVSLPRLSPIDMDNFRLDVRPDRIGHVMGRRQEILHALREVFGRRAGDDDLNRLIVNSSLGISEVDILRAYVAYLGQLGLPFGAPAIRSALVEYASVAEAMIAWLAARFDPKTANPSLVESSEALLARELRAVTDYTADRVLAAVASAIRATRRTNAFRIDRDPRDPLAFKLASAELAFVPAPKPFREIWIHHADFEGVHLRGGPVARGGIRFSDRPEDFRTEIHGLMATQMVKNVLIVPVGAKGGFVLRDPPKDRVELRRAGDRVYALFVSALLGLTDNVVGGQPMHPEGIVPFLEGFDPYLVVAADKGTAHLSDTANAMSARFGHWLDDAFASGGSNGYDHKQTGITARGAWEVSKRSFRELGIDPETDVITAVGVGDMSGDVFGNGLLRSRTVKLVAAFNHVHIFVDPNPDPEASYRERKRLFEMPGSAWTDYDPAVLSSGGGVYVRQAKDVPLSPQARALLGFMPEQHLRGEDVIRAILRARVDLIWMGGIGTYVKAKSEGHGEVGDKTNDAVRVDAELLRCRVLAEGANLSITDRGRVEYARRGGQNYNAFLDNSGGVDTSDHEVNIKILFAPLLARKVVSREERNRSLVACEPEVVEMVLDNNRTQSRMVSFDVRRSAANVHRYSRAIRYLVDRVPFEPQAFAMPTDEELQIRGNSALGLYKPEAAVLGAHAKMLAYRELLEAEPLPDPIVDAAVREYFPARIQELAGSEALRGHLLRREIATTMIVNRIVGDGGGSLLAELSLATGRSTRDVVLACLFASSAGGVPGLLRELYAIEDKRSQEGVYRAMGRVQDAIEDASLYVLDQTAFPPLGAEAIDQSLALLGHVHDVLPAGSRERTAGRIENLCELGLPRGLASRIVLLRYLTPILDAVRLATTLGRSPDELLVLRLSVTDAVNFLYLYQAMDRMVYATPWDGPAVSALRRQLNFHLQKLVRLVEGDDVQGMIRHYRLEGFCQRVAEEAQIGPTISGLVMLDDWIRRALPPLTAIEAQMQHR